MTLNQFAIVVWDDAHGSATKDVTEKELPHAPVVMKTLGWLLRQDDIGISIANEVFYEDGVAYFRGHTFIPAKMIRSATVFNIPKRKAKPHDQKHPPHPQPGPDTSPLVAS